MPTDVERIAKILRLFESDVQEVTITEVIHPNGSSVVSVGFFLHPNIARAFVESKVSDDPHFMQTVRVFVQGGKYFTTEGFITFKDEEVAKGILESACRKLSKAVLSVVKLSLITQPAPVPTESQGGVFSPSTEELLEKLRICAVDKSAASASHNSGNQNTQA